MPQGSLRWNATAIPARISSCIQSNEGSSGDPGRDHGVREAGLNELGRASTEPGVAQGTDSNVADYFAGAGPKRATPLYRTSCIMLCFAALVSNAQAESGLASYYRYGSRGGMTCAHKTLPFGSIVTVFYSGRSIRCRINDRGPFIRGRIIDLSVTAARALGMMEAGVVRVSVE